MKGLSGWIWLILIGLVILGIIAFSISVTPNGITLMLNWSGLI